MNHLIQMLRLIVCLYLGFASIAAWADSRDDAMDARDVAMGNISAAEVQPRKVARETQASLIEKALGCDPVFVVASAYWFRLSDESFEESVSKPYKEVLKFRGCQDQDISEEMRNAFLNKYVIFYLAKTADVRPRGQHPFTYDEAKQKYEEGGWEPARVEARESFEIDKKEKTKREVQQKEETRRAEALRIRIADLKKGVILVSNLDDAVLVHDPKSLNEIIVSPLLIPDKGVYKGAVILDEQEGENLLRVKVQGGGNRYQAPYLYYATLLWTKKTISFSSQSMRIGGGISVIGRYVKNKKYKTLAGEGKTMPVIEVMYIGD